MTIVALLAVIIGLIIALAVYLLRGDHRCAFKTEGIMLDGSIIEACPKCTRVRVFLIDLDGQPVDLVEINRLKGESVGECMLRHHKDAQENNEASGEKE
jgi:hypothetical protein